MTYIRYSNLKEISFEKLLPRGYGMSSSSTNGIQLSRPCCRTTDSFAMRRARFSRQKGAEYQQSNPGWLHRASPKQLDGSYLRFFRGAIEPTPRMDLSLSLSTQPPAAVRRNRPIRQTHPLT